ncbi:hypothetical protein T440DRAFT_550057 [Plenodomus tracheiphilus IPT5]|uniref:DUF1989 domain-containing protein n=1 Tax=Plenodomus tracheiphilus IPT5 TaxID=1408161 RepID=A0A6A7BN16_9PLEO|nr:hypothetical protein T440DRAFT_550057 [Plenodomus tracheiphilus IPT5]
MSGELQTIPARHGVATFVPRGRTIKVINTYGKQLVSMWAFSLGAPPEKDEEGEEVDEVKVKEEAEGLKKAVEAGAGEETSTVPEAESQEAAKEGEKVEDEGTRAESKTTSEETKDTQEGAEDPPEQAPDASENEKPTENLEGSSKKDSKRTWASYLPSIPYRNKGAASKPDAEKKPNAEEEKAQNEANTKKWSSYIPTGKSFSSYVPNVQIPDSKEAVSSFKASHYRDPNKSYAEQLYDFSKTPVGAGTIAGTSQFPISLSHPHNKTPSLKPSPAATGSGYASSVYAAYSAYTSTHPSSTSQPPMEYLSLPHTRASTHKLVPSPPDQLLTNLRNPILTLIQDTSPGAHDTLTAACDANLYLALGTPKPEEHGSCAENLVLALQELNETAGLKGAKAIGADISVNIAPTPLHLFMNAPLEFEHAEPGGKGARGITLRVEEPVGGKRSFVRFRAERDVVVVLSACPMDVGGQNGGRCMAANFMVEDVEEGLKGEGEKKTAGKKELNRQENPPTSQQNPQSEIETPTKSNDKKFDKSAEAKSEQQPQKKAPKKLAPKTDAKPPTKDESTPTQQDESAKDGSAKKDESSSGEPKPKKKPRKLQPRGGSAGTSVKSS